MDHARLYQLAERQERDDDLDSLEAAVVAYARWQGMTDEDETRRERAKQLLEKYFEELEPDDWQRLRDFTPLIGAEAVRNIIAYTFNRAYDDLKDKTLDLERHFEESSGDDDNENGAPRRERRRRRDRER